MRLRSMMLLCAFAFGCRRAPPPRATAAGPRETTVCAMIANFRAFANQTVVFDALVESDGIHRTLLLDERCNRGLNLVWRGGPPPGGEEIEQAIFQGTPGTDGKRITGRFTAVLRPQAHPTPPLFAYDLVVSRIENLRIEIAAQP